MSIFLQKHTTVALGILLVLLNTGTALAQSGTQEPTRPVVYMNMEGGFGGIGVADLLELTPSLAELGLLPGHANPTVLMLTTIHSGQFELERENLRTAWEYIRTSTSETGAPEPILLLSPRNSEAARRNQGVFFPENEQQLVEAGFEWLVQADWGEIRWENTGIVSEKYGLRYQVGGIEEIAGTQLILCVDDASVLGWAHSAHSQQPGAAGLGRFIEDCTEGRTTLEPSPALADELREQHGLLEGPFALLLPRYTYSESLAAFELARGNLAASRIPIQLRVVAVETATEDISKIVERGEHEELLVELGLPVDSDLSAQLPDWLADYGHYRASLLLFNADGHLEASFYVNIRDFPTIPNLMQHLLMQGYF